MATRITGNMSAEDFEDIRASATSARTQQVHSSSSSGDTQIPQKPPASSSGVPTESEVAAKTQHVVELDEDAGDLEAIDSGITDAYRQLPGAPTNLKSINWFGSSYSGVDIKVVAHLYGDKAELVAKEKVQREKDIATKIVDACSTLIGGALSQFASSVDQSQTFDFRRELFLNAAGLGNQLDEINQAAGTYMVNAVMLGGNFSSFLGLAKTRRLLEDIIQAQQAAIRNLVGKIKALEEMQGKAQQTIVLASLQTISIQSHREKYAVRACGHSYAKGYTRGPRTIAGSMIFTAFDEHALLALIRSMGNSKTYGELDSDLKSLIPDQLPPIDLTLVFANEYGSISSRRLFGVEFVNDGSTYSIEDLMSEDVINFVCRDADILTAHGNVRLSRLQSGGLHNEFASQDLSGTYLVFNDKRYDEYVETLGVRRRLMHR